MGSNRAALDKKVNELQRKTKLHKQVVQSLVERYQCQCKDKGLDRDTLRGDLMHEFNMLDDFLLDRIFRTFDVSAIGQHLKMDDYVTGMAVFLTQNLDDKIRFCFSVYDLNGDGYITREEMYQFLKHSMVEKAHGDAEDDADDSTKDLTEIILKKLDNEDHDGRVSYQDFHSAVMGDKLLLEALGQCLPDEKCRSRYLQILGDPSLNNQQASTVIKVQKKQRPHSQMSRKSAQLVRTA